MISNTLTLPLNPALLRPKTQPVEHLPRRKVEQKQAPHRFIPSAEEARTITALKAKEPAALDRLVRDHSQRIFGAILRLVRDADEAASLVQETFLQALRSLDAFRGQAKVSTWLYGIAMNVTRAHLRRKIQHRRVLSEQEIDWLQPEFTWRGTHAERYTDWDPEVMIEKQERAALLRKAIDRLPERYRVVLVMRDLEELSTTEVAEALSISEGNVRVRLHRARNTVRALLASHLAAE